MRAPSLVPFAPFAVALLASLSAIACSSTGETAGSSGGTSGPPEGDAESMEEPVSASCTNPRRYFATFSEADLAQACTPIPGYHGQWIPEALFSDAPADVQMSTCAYRWSGEKYSRPDRDALVARVGVANGLAPACGTTANPDIGTLQPIPHIDDWTMAGSVGCDVCGVLRGTNVWVILPPARIALRQFQVTLDNGESRAFRIENAGAGALSIALPPALAGTHYLEGRFHVY